VALSEPTITQLETFMGVPEGSLEVLTLYGPEALTQGTDMMMLATSVQDDPTDAGTLRVMQRGICAMAEAFIFSKEPRRLALFPFKRELLGGYEYEKFAKQVSLHQPTGVMWFDMAVDLLLGNLIQPEADELLQSISVFENDNVYDVCGRSAVLGPADADYFGYYTRGVHDTLGNQV
jgi:hypothetical protein